MYVFQVAQEFDSYGLWVSVCFAVTVTQQKGQNSTLSFFQQHFNPFRFSPPP